MSRIGAGTWAPTWAKPGIPQEKTPKAASSPTARNLHWAAGFLEGEGHFRRSGTSSEVASPQVNPEPLYHLQALFGGGVSHGNRKGEDLLYYWVVTGARARGLMMTLFPFLSSRRQDQIRSALL